MEPQSRNIYILETLQRNFGVGSHVFYVIESSWNLTQETFTSWKLYSETLEWDPMYFM